MEFRLKYDEIDSFIEQKTGRKIGLSFASEHCVHVGMDVNVLMKSMTMGLDISVDRIEGSDIFLSYSGGMGIEFMVKTALQHAKNQPGGDVVEILDGNRLLLALGKNAQAGSLLSRVTLNDVRFDEKYAIVDFTPKV
ncbi:MAG: hypothetical protein IJ761_07705 [Bacteroidales bacterium]|nr:hypothetical protein [Bacteroidales bacterium]